MSMRPAELAASAEVIGFDEVVMLGYRDSGMADSEPNAHPDCFHQADLDEATGRLVAIIRRTRPQVIITYNDDQQGYPHPDHLRVHDISVLAFERAGDPAWYPELGRAVPAVEALLLDVEPAPAGGDARGSAAAHAASRRSTTTWFERPDTDHRVTTRIEVGDFMWARTQSLLAHATQVDPTAGVLVRSRPTTNSPTSYPWEDWILARSLVGDDPDHRRPSTTCSPAIDAASTPSAGRRERAVPGRRRQEGRAGRRSRRRRHRRHGAGRRRRGAPISTPPSSSCAVASRRPVTPARSSIC